MMKVWRSNQAELTPQEQRDLEKLRAIVERAIADGKLSQEEQQEIRAAIFADGKVTPEELTMVREIIKEKLGEAELEYDW